MRGDLELFTEGGHISIENVSGTVKATTNGGKLMLNGLRVTYGINQREILQLLSKRQMSKLP